MMVGVWLQEYLESQSPRNAPPYKLNEQYTQYTYTLS